MYLNRVYFGSGFYGVETAARGYFGKDAKDLNLSEAATLAGLLRNPNSLSPWSNRKACIESRNFVLGRMRDMKYITPEVYDQSIAADLVVKNKKTKHSESYAIDLIRQKVEKEVGLDNASSDGYSIYTTIDGDLQKKAQESLQKELLEVEEHDGYKHQTYAQYDAIFRDQAKKSAEGDSDNSALPVPEYLQGSVVAIDNATGGIVAVVGGRDFDQSQFQREFSKRPVGTAFEPLVYAAAFEKGIFPGALFLDSVMDNRLVMIGGTTGILGEWGPERIDNKYEGFIPARFALVKSKNAATVRLGMATGLDKVLAMAKSAGVTSPLRPFPATYLGSSDVSLMEMTMAYTAFPNLGWKPAKPFIIKRIEEKGGNVVFQEPLERKEVMKPTTAYEVHSALSEVLEWGTGDKAITKYGLKKLPFAGKTGTAYNFTDEWFIGYSSEITCGVWAGFDKSQQPIYRGAFSSDIALPVWVDIMNASAANYKPREVEMPRGLSKYKICLTSGLLATDKCIETTVDKATGQSLTRPTTYYEIGTLDQVPKDYCVHGEGPKLTPQAVATASNATTTPDGTEVRKAIAVDDPNAKIVPVQGEAVLGQDDPYRSIKPTVAPSDAKPSDSNTAPIENTQTPPGANASKPDVEVRRAEPVRTLDDNSQDSNIKVDPPPPLDF
jgi:penicillin-binding protein 1A